MTQGFKITSLLLGTEFGKNATLGEGVSKRSSKISNIDNSESRTEYKIETNERILFTLV